MAHVDLWEELWGRWVLLGDSGSVQWVPSHVGISENEKADALHGSARALRAVAHDREVRDIWSDLGLEEMSSDDNQSKSDALSGGCGLVREFEGIRAVGVVGSQ